MSAARAAFHDSDDVSVVGGSESFFLDHLQHGLLATRAAVAFGGSKQNDQHEDAEGNQCDDSEHHIFILVVAHGFSDRLVLTNDAVERFHGFFNRGVPFLLLQVRHHHSVLHPSADGVGKRAFQSRSGQDLVGAVLRRKHDDESRVLFRRSDFIFPRQFHSELIGVIAFQSFHDDHHGLHALVFFQVEEDAVRSGA